MDDFWVLSLQDYVNLIIFAVIFLGTIPVLIKIGETIFQKRNQKSRMGTIYILTILFILVYLLPYIYLFYVKISKEAVKLLSVIAIIYIIIYIIRRYKPHFRSKDYIKVLPLEFKKFSEIYFLAHWLHSSYRGAPWNEQKICPVCKNPDDFGPKDIHSHSLKYCPNCGSELTNFWSVERTKNYVRNATSQKSFFGLGAYTHNELVGWIWGYEVNSTKFNLDKSKTAFYIDVVGVLPAHRTNNIFRSLKRKTIAFLKRIFKESVLFEVALNFINPPLVVRLYHFLIKELKSRKYDIILTRTHTQAHKVHRLLSLSGFVKMYADPSDRSREFWKKEI